jgi:hypothetical protein
LIDLVAIISTIAACVGAGYGVYAYHRPPKKPEAEGDAAAPSLTAPSSSHPTDDSHVLLLSICQHLADSVSSWFKERFAKLEQFASAAELNAGDATQQKQYLETIAPQLESFTGGLYALDVTATVTAQHTPKAPTVPDLRGYVYTARDYFTECRQQLRPIVSNVFTSHNREIEIIVAAAPLFNDRGTFIGILDGVIDIVNSPFSTMARNALRDVVFPNQLKTKAFRLIIIDKNKRIIGSSHGQVDRRSSVAENPVVQRLFNGKADNRSFTCGEGAIVSIDSTPYFVICHEHGPSTSS